MSGKIANVTFKKYPLTLIVIMQKIEKYLLGEDKWKVLVLVLVVYIL